MIYPKLQIFKDLKRSQNLKSVAKSTQLQVQR